MVLSIIKKIPFKEKKTLVKEACEIYLKAKQINDNKSEQRNKAVAMFETLISLLDHREQRIIKNDFIEKLDKDWYKSYSSKYEYEKRKRSAIDNFVFILFA